MTTKQLHISPTLSLPIDAVTQTFLVLGKRGSGKSNAGVVLAEEMLKLGAPIVALDPVDHFWGLKARGDGSPGFPIYVFGGNHADVPLTPTAGALMADVAVDQRIPMVLSMKGMSGGERARFVTDFAERLLNRNEQPIHVFVEEADAFIPQRPYKGEERMLGAMDRLVRWGRQSGVGCTAISQRSAKINKDITTQAEVLVACRTTGPQDRDVIDDWIKYHEGGSRRQEVLETLAKLSDGESWLWSPEWLEYFGRMQWRRRETFDAAKTPKLGEKVLQPRLATVDLEQLESKMAATIERAKADDPRELRRRIVELERELAKKPTAAEPEIVEKVVEVQVLDQWRVDRIGDARSYVKDAIEQLERALVGTEYDPAADGEGPRENGTLVTVPPTPARRQRPTVAQRQDVLVRAINHDITAPQQRILDALARLESVRVDQPLKTQVALFAGASPTSSAFTNNLGSLRSSALIHYPSKGYVSLTDAGRAAANPVEVPVSSAELQASVCELIGLTRWRLLKVLIDIFPRSIDKPSLADRAGASPTSSAFTNNLGALRSLGFLDYPQTGYVAAEPVLFVEEAMVAAR